MGLFVNGFGLAMKKALIVSCSFVTSVTAFALSDDQYTKTLGNAATGASISSLINQEDQKTEGNTTSNSAYLTTAEKAGTVNTDLINRIADVNKGKNGYIKEALSTSLKASKGELTSGKKHFAFTAILGCWANEVGVNNQSIPQYYFEPTKWEKGNKNRTIMGYTSRSTGTRSVDDGTTAYGAFQYTNNNSVQMNAKAKVNPTCGNTRGYSPGDARFWPDCFNHIETLYNAAWKDIDLSQLSKNGKPMIAGLCNNRGNAGTIRYSFGCIYNVNKLISESKSSHTSHDIKYTMKYFTDMFDEWYDKNGAKVGKKLLTYANAANARGGALAIALHNKGWYVSPACRDYYSGKGKPLLVQGWKDLYPSDSGNIEKKAMRALKEATCTSISKSIQLENSKNVSAFDCNKVYGSQSQGSISFSGSVGYFIWHVSTERSTGRSYLHKYSNGDKPFLISRFDNISFGYMFSNYPAIGEYIYGAMLKAAGVDGVDPTNPDSYMSSTSVQKTFTPADISGSSKKKARKILINYNAVGWDTLNDKRVKVLTEAINIIASGKYRYVFGGSHTDSGVTKDNKYCVGHAYDCSSFVRAMISLGTGFYPCQTSGFYSQESSLFKKINKGDLKAGDVVKEDHAHVTLFAGWLNKDKTVEQTLEAKGKAFGIVCDRQTVTSGFTYVRRRNIDK